MSWDSGRIVALHNLSPELADVTLSLKGVAGASTLVNVVTYESIPLSTGARRARATQRSIDAALDGFDAAERGLLNRRRNQPAGSFEATR